MIENALLILLVVIGIVLIVWALVHSVFESAEKANNKEAVIREEAYDFAKEETLIENGDFEGWLEHIKGRPIHGQYIFDHYDIAHIAKSIYRIMESNKGS